MDSFVMKQSWTDTRQQDYAWQLSSQENAGSCNNCNNNYNNKSCNNSVIEPEG